MGFKKFITKSALRLKGVSSTDAEKIAEELDANPELAAKFKGLNDNPEVAALFKKIEKEVDALKKSGVNDMYATMNVMSKYKAEVAKHREALEPLLSAFMHR